MSNSTSDALAALNIQVVEGTDAAYQPRSPSRRRHARPATETSIREDCANLIMQSGGHCIVKHQTMYGTRGTPDLIGCINGRMVVIEVKRTDVDPPGPEQIGRLRKWQEVGALAGWVRSVEHLRQILDHLDDFGWRNDFAVPGDGRISLPEELGYQYGH